ncbi:MIP/aquaporin family protein [Mesomycoplasma lagogenitalium]|uniref:Aquaporin family protein n=1 Tax=Mesomycoplasma lagogenitalium TaxID=171286 RepID=A0ABY8LUY3_9BACT|nr:MIP/aquaporin family protein [Mesomycoplasma lagogenitalium]WGI37042.1 aquaporin family protein [Mesomycoplasma lagogenitalium]
MNIIDQFLPEFLGTLILVFFANGVGYSTSAQKMFASSSSSKWLLISFTCGFGLFIAIIIAYSLNGVAHLNPAISIYFSIYQKQPLFLLLIIFQFLGAFSAQIILNFINWKHIQVTDLVSIRNSHCTFPAFANKEKATIFNFSYELIATMMLIGFLLASERGINKQILSGLGPIPVSILVVVIGMAIGSSTGFALNPARDLGPRIIYRLMELTILKKRKDQHIGANWSYSWIPTLAPTMAGIIIGLFALI